MKNLSKKGNYYFQIETNKKCGVNSKCFEKKTVKNFEKNTNVKVNENVHFSVLRGR